MNARQPDAAPTEFMYWDHLEKPWVRRTRALCTRLFGFDPAPSAEQVETFASMYFDADPLAEAFVDEVFLNRDYAQGRAILDQALREGVHAVPNPPQSLLNLFEDLDRSPEWMNPEKVALGAKVFRRYGSSVFHFAGAITLAAYSENSVAKPLALTGAYAGASTKNRFLETASFWIEVSEPNGLDRYAPGFQAALRVRIMHVFVRRKLLAHKQWKLNEWGVPISQADALLTLMGGSVAPGLALKVMGYRPSTQDIEAMMHFWRYVGHLMGVRPRFFPNSIREAAQLGFMALVKGADRSGEDGRLLCHSFADAFKPNADDNWKTRLRDSLQHRIHLGYTRFFLPPPIYRKNKLPAAGLWALHPLLQSPFIFAAETMRRRISALDDVADRRARKQRRRWLDRHMGQKTAHYQPVSNFTR